MSNFAFTPAFESRQYLGTQCFHDNSTCEYKPIINPDEDETLAILAKEQGTVTVATHEAKIMQQIDQHLVPFTCCLLEAIQSLFQLPYSPTGVTRSLD